MVGFGINSKAVVISVVIHGLMASGFMITNLLGDSDDPPMEIIDVSLFSPSDVQKPAPTPQPPPPKKVEVPKPVEDDEAPPQQAKTTPKTQPDPVKKPVQEPEKKPEPEKEVTASTENTSGASIDEEPDTVTSATSEFSNAEFSGSFDAPGFDYPDWNYRGFKKIARAWRNKAFSTKPLSCTIYFRILKSGRVYGVRIKESSGNPVYDRGCQEAVQDASPLPPLPDEYRYEEIGVSLVFPYNPR